MLVICMMLCISYFSLRDDMKQIKLK